LALLSGAWLLSGSSCREGLTETPPTDVVASVNGENLTTTQLSKALLRARRDNENLSPRTGADQQAFRAAVLEDFINRSLVLQAARKAGVSVAPEKVDRELLRLKAEYPGPAFDQALAEGAQSPEELREQIRNRLMVEQYFAEQVFTRVAITDADVESYYKDHLADFAQPEEVHAEQILVDDADAAKHVLAELKQGERFEELARKYSRSPEAKIGGDLGFFPRGRMPEVFDRVCFALKKNEISEVVTSPYGFHIFKLLEKRAAGTPSLEEAKPRVEARLRKERQEALQQAKLAELRQQAQIQINDKVLAEVQ
jgi:peptidyl-prolyl cis-trans isomerase C/foldase protein PrsA